MMSAKALSMIVSLSVFVNNTIYDYILYNLVVCQLRRKNLPLGQVKSRLLGARALGRDALKLRARLSNRYSRSTEMLSR